MKKPDISIVTAWGGSLGNGHIQRMAGLALYLNSRGSSASIISKTVPLLEQRDLSGLVRPVLPRSSDLIIRDMRDSTAGEILELKKAGPVLSIDDIGPGRIEADFNADLLPGSADSPEARHFQERNFLYGINFTDSIRMMDTEPVKKDIDVVVYPGQGQSEEYTAFLLSLIPDSASVALLGSPSPLLIRKGTRIQLRDMNVARLLLSSRVLLSHFGITLYEAHLARCGLITVNPTDYHSSLADLSNENLGVINLGTADSLDTESARRAVADAIARPSVLAASPADALADIERRLDSFHTHIMNCIL